MLDYWIVVPSRQRAHKMEGLLELLPNAHICVAEDEAPEYGRHVPAAQLMLHPPSLTGCPAARNWIIDHCPASCVVQCDDDLRGVVCNVGSGRWITDPEEILAVLENAMIACNDLGLTTFCFSRTPNTTVIRPNERPIVPVQQAYGCVGTMRGARKRRYDETLKSRADLDWTMRTLLEDRCLYADVRFYFDFGASFSGSGGNTGRVSGDDFKIATKTVAKRWGRYVSFKRPGFMKQGDTWGGKPNVRRTNKLAQK